MRKAICPQPSKRVYFIKGKGMILELFKKLRKIISNCNEIQIVSGISFQTFAESGVGRCPAVNDSENGNTSE